MNFCILKIGVQCSSHILSADFLFKANNPIYKCFQNQNMTGFTKISHTNVLFFLSFL